VYCTDRDIGEARHDILKLHSSTLKPVKMHPDKTRSWTPDYMRAHGFSLLKDALNQSRFVIPAHAGQKRMAL
jgi:hypothetical protein